MLFSAHTYYGVFEGYVEEVSPNGDYGFVYPHKIRPYKGFETKPVPKQRIFVHIRKVVDVRKLKNGLPLIFEVVDSKRQEGKLEANDVVVRPRLHGTVRLPNGRTDYGFIDADTIDLDPDWDEDMVNDEHMPRDSVFVHVSALNAGPRQLANGMRVSFFAMPSKDGEDKFEAKQVDRL